MPPEMVAFTHGIIGISPSDAHPCLGIFDKKESHTKWLSATKWQINANTDIILQNCAIIKLSA